MEFLIIVRKAGRMTAYTLPFDSACEAAEDAYDKFGACGVTVRLLGGV